MKILFVGAEAVPFISTGGLGDVLGSLPQSIVACDPKADVRVVLPLYQKIKENNIRFDAIEVFIYKVVRDKSGNEIGREKAKVYKDINNVIENLEIIKNDYYTIIEKIKQGKAKILTVISDNKVEEFDINIIRINENSTTKTNYKWC